MRKQVIAFLFAFGITAIIALSMLVVGVTAATNPNGVAVSNSPNSASAGLATGSPQAQIAQLKDQIAQYQAREQQYQAALNSDSQQLSQAAQNVEMIRQLLAYLQDRGLIQINNQGQINIPGD